MRKILISLFVIFLLIATLVIINRPNVSPETKFQCKMEIFIDIDKHRVSQQRLEDFSFTRSSSKAFFPKIVFNGKSTWFGFSEFYTLGNSEDFQAVMSGGAKIFMNREYFHYSHTSAIATQVIVAKCKQSIP
jgi:hypothetical protein